MSDLGWGFSDAGTKLTSHTFLKIPYSLSFQIHCHLYHQLKQIALCSPDRLKKNPVQTLNPTLVRSDHKIHSRLISHLFPPKTHYLIELNPNSKLEI